MGLHCQVGSAQPVCQHLQLQPTPTAAYRLNRRAKISARHAQSPPKRSCYASHRNSAESASTGLALQVDSQGSASSSAQLAQQLQRICSAALQLPLVAAAAALLALSSPAWAEIQVKLQAMELFTHALQRCSILVSYRRRCRPAKLHNMQNLYKGSKWTKASLLCSLLSGQLRCLGLQSC